MGKQGYHHGALGEALILASEAIISEKGIHGFSLREAARRAGVAASAPAHHFGNVRGLLTAVATKTLGEFADTLERALQVPEAERIAEQGLAYVRFALRHRALYDLMWRYDVVDQDNPFLMEQKQRAFRALEALVSPSGPAEPSDRPRAIALWALVHGLARLILDGPVGIKGEAPEKTAETLVPQIFDALNLSPSKIS